MKNIKKMISFSKKNHYIESDEKKILKIPGLSLSCLKRNEINCGEGDEMMQKTYTRNNLNSGFILNENGCLLTSKMNPDTLF